MLRKFAAVLIAATVLSAPALAAGNATRTASPATHSAKMQAGQAFAAKRTVKVKKHKSMKKAKATRHAKHSKHAKHRRHVRGHNVRHVSRPVGAPATARSN